MGGGRFDRHLPVHSGNRVFNFNLYMNSLPPFPKFNLINCPINKEVN